MLLLQDQDRVAEAMGYADANTLMQNLAGAAHTIEWATERFWWRVDRLVLTIEDRSDVEEGEQNA